MWKSVGADNYIWTICADSAMRPDGVYYFHIVGRAVGQAEPYRAVVFTLKPTPGDPNQLPPPPGTYSNRVWDSEAGKLVSWGSSPDPTGESYPGPGTFGQQTSDYCIVRRG
jgi:hypothetical protein